MTETEGQIENMVARGYVTDVNPAKKMQELQVVLLSDEPVDNIEHFEPYGFTSNPNPGAETVAVFMGGERSHGVVIVVADRRYRMKALETGEVALHDDQGQCVHLTRDGIVVRGAGKPITFTDTPEIIADTPLLRTTGDVLVAGDIVANGDISDQGTKSMRGMRTAYNGHKGHNLPGTTPDQSM